MLQNDQNARQPAAQAVFHKVAENLYRLESSGTYYALTKRGGKQFRRSLKTNDRKLAERRLKEFKEKIGQLSLSDDARLTFEEVARKRWLESVKHSLDIAWAAGREKKLIRKCEKA